MPGRPWTPAEDDAIRAAVEANRSIGLTDEDGGGEYPRWRARRLQAVADEIGRTLAAVRKRAQRLGERSYRPSAHAGIVARIDSSRTEALARADAHAAKLDAVAHDVAFLAGRRKERDHQGGGGA